MARANLYVSGGSLSKIPYLGKLQQTVQKANEALVRAGQPARFQPPTVTSQPTKPAIAPKILPDGEAAKPTAISQVVAPPPAVVPKVVAPPPPVTPPPQTKMEITENKDGTVTAACPDCGVITTETPQLREQVALGGPGFSEVASPVAGAAAAPMADGGSIVMYVAIGGAVLLLVIVAYVATRR